ncbi:serine/threonine-protein kinase PknG [Actinokineospora baliensis]|uniref:serine/threonine-protein kinase n=1 Tax=Actinokineospora baliensis TaxID=547056 RepID=UPI001957D672|nr:serine/threonine-protein kinase [Actinokineospora baliensis]MBM7774359.1 serine/threonine-protein kinase PknG [Actinokineospora baliensis]
MVTCPRPGCAGEIDETGYCDTCDLAPPVERPTAPAHSSPSPGPSRRTSGEFLLPEYDFPSAVERVRADISRPSGARRCPNEECPDRSRLPAEESGYCLACGKPFSFAPSLAPGTVVEDRYRVLGCIDHGGLGWIYLAEATRLRDSLCVLKGLIDPSDVALADAELWALTEIDHPNIVRVTDFVQHQDPHTGRPRGYIVMEYVSGLPLSEVALKAHNGERGLSEPLRAEHVITCVLQVLAAFDYLHGRGLLYCDLKPANVIMRAAGRDNRVKLIDLGAVRRVKDPSRGSTGTKGFQVSPAEIAEHGLTVASDIHTVGETLHVLYRATADHTGQHLTAVEHRSQRDRTAVGLAALERVWKRATHEVPGRRFASAAEMADQLRGVRLEIASLRDGRPRPEPSTVFAAVPDAAAARLDAGLGEVPQLTRWTRRSRAIPLPDLELAVDQPTPAAVAIGLPVPRAFADDPAATVLDAAVADDPARLLVTLTAITEPTVETHLARCRANLALEDIAAAEADLAAARARASDWRIAWHDGLLSLAKAETTAARFFEEVYQSLPGEMAPKLALAYCAERQGNREEATRLYLAVWRRDHSVASAAFGLVRTRLAKGDRAGAVELLDEVPAESRHYDAARVAAVRVLSGLLANRARPTDIDLHAATTRLDGLYLDGGSRAGESRTRLDTVIQEARFGCAADEPDRDLRERLELCYRALAQQATDRNDHSDLVDLSHQCRPFTLL